MLVSYPHKPTTMYKPVFKRANTDLPVRSASPVRSLYGDSLRPSYDLPPRAPSPAGSFYSIASSNSSSPSLASVASGSKRLRPLPTPPPLAIDTDWLALDHSPQSESTDDRSPRRSTSSDMTSPPDTPVDTDGVSEAARRRKQLEKATRILGEEVPLELVFKPRHPLVRARHAFPDPPVRRSTEGPQPGTLPREVLTERRRPGAGPGKIARRASLSLSTFTAKFRTGSGSAAHSRDSSQDSEAPSASSDNDHGHTQDSPPTAYNTRTPPMARRRSLILTSPILFAFPRRGPILAPVEPVRAQTPLHSPSPPQTPALDFEHAHSPGFVIDICGVDPSDDEDEGGDDEDDTAPTPVLERPPRQQHHAYSTSDSHIVRAPRLVPMPTHNPTGSEQVQVRPRTPFEDYAPPQRPDTPFADYLPPRPDTSFADYAAPARPQTPFIDYAPARPGTPFTDLDPVEPVPDAAFLSAGVSRKERGQGWSGEWNQRDMQDVIQKLRSLK